MNPPLRTDEHVAGLVALLREGAVDAVATDHAPHPPEAKERPFDEAAFGMLGLQHALGVTVEALGGPAAVDLGHLFSVLSRRPAAIARLRAVDPRVGGHAAHGGDVAAGEDANLCVVDLSAPHAVTLASLASRGHNSPYLGRTLPVSVRHTILRGSPTVRDTVATR